MKFVEFAHPEGGRMLINVDHITGVHYRRADGDVKSRLGFDLDERQNEIIIFGEEADRMWEKLQRLVGET